MAINRLDLRGTRGPLAEVLPRPSDPGSSVAEGVRAIIARVRAEGDEALFALTKLYDGADLDVVAVAPDEMAAAHKRIPAELAEALEVAFQRICDYHAHESPVPEDFDDGVVRVRHLVRPVSRVGCYVPGGLARYPSTVLMCVGPARVAGVKEIVLCVPPRADGTVDDATLAAADIAGVDALYRVGGAQAIAAMAYGTESIAPVDIIVGPGNNYVAEAKRQLSGVVGVASAFAGPSEIVVVADDSANPEWVAIDVIVQAEHGPDGTAWCVTWSPEAADNIEAAIEAHVAHSPRRDGLEASLAAGGYICVVDDLAMAMDVVNIVAPEHLELIFDGAEEALDLVINAAAVFVGPYAPASLGDYVAGPNHVLPTNRSARFSSSLRADDFRRFLHAVFTDQAGLATLGPYVETLATVEGLPAHALSVRLRS